MLGSMLFDSNMPLGKEMEMKITILVLVCCVFHFASAQLRLGFYRTSCPQAESIVRQVVKERFNTDHSITAALLRMHFHDCFVRGCDASILIDSTRSKSSEKDAGPNQTKGYELIDEAKRKLEAVCPSTVSCADIITLATRDAVALAGGPGYNVTTGRRDGLVSDLSEVNLPGPSLSVVDTAQFFIAKGLTLNDMVVLLGAHTVGVAHCVFFQDRLSNFQGTGKPDSMDPALAAKLFRICGTQFRPLNKDPTVFLDQNTSFIVDNAFYNQIMSREGILQIDEELAMDRSSARLVSRLASNNNNLFRRSFVNAMRKMGVVEVLVGKKGEIRKNCRVFNRPVKHIGRTPRKTAH